MRTGEDGGVNVPGANDAISGKNLSVAGREYGRTRSRPQEASSEQAVEVGVHGGRRFFARVVAYREMRHQPL